MTTQTGTQVSIDKYWLLKFKVDILTVSTVTVILQLQNWVHNFVNTSNLVPYGEIKVRLGFESCT